MAYQINLTGKEIDERLQNVGTAEDVAAADGTLYARISKNADDIAENKENVKTLIKRVDVVTGTANGAEALAKINEKRINEVQVTANTALKNSEINQDNVRNAQITANEAKALVEGLTIVTKRTEVDVSKLNELNIVYPNNIRNLTTESTVREIQNAFRPVIGGGTGIYIALPHVGYLIKGNKNSDNQDDPDSTIISVEIVKIEDKDCHKFMYIDNNRDLVTMTVYLEDPNSKVIERSVVSNIDTIIDKTNTFGTDISALQTAVVNNKTEQDAIAQKVEKNATAIGKHTTTLTEHDARQTNIEKVVLGAQEDAYFSLLRLNFVFNNSCFNGYIDNVEVRLYRWSGKRYARFEMFTRNNTGGSQKSIGYEIILKQIKEDAANVRTPYIHYDDDATEESLVDALKSAFGGRISYRNFKKRRWRLQAFLNGKPITAPFDFRVSVDNGDNVYLTKGGMMRSVPKTSEVVYDGYFDGDSWLHHKKGSQFNIDFFRNEHIIRRFPTPGDPVSATGETYGAVVAVKENATATAITYNILWTNGIALYEIGVLEGAGVLSYTCTSPAKKLCGDIYDYASKMNSGTLRDLYISAGAKYNEATGFYELNGLTDITEEEMRTIWQENLSGWYLKGRTNLTSNISAKGNAGGYNGGIDICNICYNNNNITIFNFGSSPFARYLDNAFSGCTKLETIDIRFPITPYGGIIGPNIFRNCSALKEVRFDMRYINYSVSVKFPTSSLISKDSVLSIIKTTKTEGSVKPLVVVGLNEAAYNRLKDDTDIIAALTEKNGFVTLTQI